MHMPSSSPVRSLISYFRLANFVAIVKLHNLIYLEYEYKLVDILFIELDNIVTFIALWVKGT